MAGVVLALGLLALAGGVVVRLRARTRDRVRGPRLDDEAVRQIVREGRVWLEDDEPLDPETIRAEEERFWREARWEEEAGWDVAEQDDDRESWQGRG